MGIDGHVSCVYFREISAERIYTDVHEPEAPGSLT